MELSILTILMSLYLGFGGTIGAVQGDEPLSILIRVTSNDPESEAVAECAYIINDEKKTFQVIEKETPFEIRVNARICYVLFKQKSKKGALAAKLYTIGKNGEFLHVSGSGHAFLMGGNTTSLAKPSPGNKGERRGPYRAPEFFYMGF